MLFMVSLLKLSFWPLLIAVRCQFSRPSPFIHVSPGSSIWHKEDLMPLALKENSTFGLLAYVFLNNAG